MWSLHSHPIDFLTCDDTMAFKRVLQRDAIPTTDKQCLTIQTQANSTTSCIQCPWTHLDPRTLFSHSTHRASTSPTPLILWMSLLNKSPGSCPVVEALQTPSAEPHTQRPLASQCPAPPSSTHVDSWPQCTIDGSHNRLGISLCQALISLNFSFSVVPHLPSLPPHLGLAGPLDVSCCSGRQLCALLAFLEGRFFELLFPCFFIAHLVSVS